MVEDRAWMNYIHGSQKVIMTKQTSLEDICRPYRHTHCSILSISAQTELMLGSKSANSPRCVLAVDFSSKLVDTSMLEGVIRSLRPQIASISPEPLVYRPIAFPLPLQLAILAKTQLLETVTQASASQTSLSHLPKSLEHVPSEGGRI